VVRIHDFDVLRQLEVTCRDGTGAFFRQRDDCFVGVVQHDADAFEVQQNVDHILLNAFHCAVFVQHVVDLHFRDGATRHRRQQNASKRVAQRVAETTLERLERHARACWPELLYIDMTGRQEFIHRLCH